MNKISRNAPCPCGSGKKYKHCCAILAQNKIIFKERIDTLLNSFTWISNNYPKYIEECAKLFFNVQDTSKLSNVYEKYGMNSLICFNEFGSIGEKY